MVHNYFTVGKKIQVKIYLIKKKLYISERFEIILTSWIVFQFWISAQAL